MTIKIFYYCETFLNHVTNYFHKKINKYGNLYLIDQFTLLLNEIDFSEIQINIYRYLLNNKYGTINDIKNELNYSYAQVYNALLYLEEKN
ncbi:MAG: helix-turn-helix domain-containing protein, partial [Promethearchaeota archaeon]